MTDDEQKFHEYFMTLALREAESSASDGEIPCGCVIVALPEGYFEPGIAHPLPLDNHFSARIVARAHNQTEMLHDPTAHAEMIAITSATETLKDWRLNRCIVYVTKEPCPMCAGALVWARPEMIVWGLSDSERGGEGAFGILSNPHTNHRARLVRGILEARCKEQFQHFFQMRRKDNLP
ncbi:MAG: nucleoside deaminase [Kiritimatiellia bacterium]